MSFLRACKIRGSHKSGVRTCPNADFNILISFDLSQIFWFILVLLTAHLLEIWTRDAARVQWGHHKIFSRLPEIKVPALVVTGPVVTVSSMIFEHSGLVSMCCVSILVSYTVYVQRLIGNDHYGQWIPIKIKTRYPTSGDKGILHFLIFILADFLVTWTKYIDSNLPCTSIYRAQTGLDITCPQAGLSTSEIRFLNPVFNGSGRDHHCLTSLIGLDRRKTCRISPWLFPFIIKVSIKISKKRGSQ